MADRERSAESAVVNPHTKTDLEVLRTELTHLIADVPGPLSHVSVSRGDVSLELRWARHGTADQTEPRLAQIPNAASPPPSLHEVTTMDDASDAAAIEVTAPLVGTFYGAPEPGAEPFVSVGARVAEGQTLCIIEAMKLMNPVESPCAGTVTDVPAVNGQAVQYGEVLVRITPEDH